MTTDKQQPEQNMMFSDVIKDLEAMSDLTPNRRRDMISALRTMARFINRDVSSVPANTEWLRQHLRQLHPTQLRVSPKRFQNVKSSVIAALRLTVPNNKRHAAFPEMSEQFNALYTAIPDRMMGYKLSRFFRYCSAQGLAPEQVTDETLKAFEQDLCQQSFHKDPSKVAREAALTWNKVRPTVPGWPDRDLHRARTRIPWTLPLENFPGSFQADVERWCARLSHADLFDPDAPLRPCRPATIKHRRFQIRMMASAIVRSGIPLSEITALADLVKLENFKQGLDYMLERQDGAVKEANFTLASGLKAIARHHVKVPEAQLTELKRICARLDQNADRYRVKNKDRLAQFDDPRNLALLLALPAHLEDISKNPGPKPRSAGLLMQSAIAIEILLFCPMRIGNLARLDIERHFRWIQQRRTLRLVIEIPGQEVKNAKPLRYELIGPSAQMIRRYCEDIRPTLCPEPTTALFPKMNGAFRNPPDLSAQIKRHVRQETGLTVNAHLFRSLASKIHNEVNAGDMATISHVLGDRMETVMGAYSQFEQQRALQHYQRSVRKVRGGDEGENRYG